MKIQHYSLIGFAYVEVNRKRPPNYSQDRIRERGSYLWHTLSACNQTIQQSPSQKLQKFDVHKGRNPHNWPNPLC
jgi:hypothetical protein